jgi:hypothetical protein
LVLKQLKLANTKVPREIPVIDRIVSCIRRLFHVETVAPIHGQTELPNCKTFHAELNAARHAYI